MNRYILLLRRFLIARKLGFKFTGVTNSEVPQRVRLNGKCVDLKYSVSSGHLSDIVNLWLDDEYGIGSLAKEPRVVVDIGGNIGLFTLWVWNHFPETKLFVFEPNPRVVRELKENVTLTKATVYEVGVSGSPGRAEMRDTRSSRMASTTFVEDGSIELRSLSQVVRDVGGEIDLLKIDCEGAEWDIFEDKEAFESIRSIRMEYHLHNGRTVNTLKSVTDALGYRMTHHSPNNGFGIAWFERAVM